MIILANVGGLQKKIHPTDTIITNGKLGCLLNSEVKVIFHPPKQSQSIGYNRQWRFSQRPLCACLFISRIGVLLLRQNDFKRKEMMDTLGKIILPIILIYIAVCFGKIAAKYGKNPLLFGILSIITPINLIILGYWAFSVTKEQKK